MFTREADVGRGLEALRRAVLAALDPGSPLIATAGAAPAAPTPRGGSSWLMSEAVDLGRKSTTGARTDSARAASSELDEGDRQRLIALVELARGGDSEAFGQLYDHYQLSVYRFLYYRVGSVALAEDLTSETFFRALRSMGSFRWQGKDFGAWLMTIARNLTTDHFKAGRTRLEFATEDMSAHDAVDRGSRVRGARLADQRDPAPRARASCPPSSRSA